MADLNRLLCPSKVEQTVTKVINKTCSIVDVNADVHALPDYRVKTKGNEKLGENADHTKKHKNKWHIKVRVMPVIMRLPGTKQKKKKDRRINIK